MLAGIFIVVGFLMATLGSALFYFGTGGNESFSEFRYRAQHIGQDDDAQLMLLVVVAGVMMFVVGIAQSRADAKKKAASAATPPS